MDRISGKPSMRLPPHGGWAKPGLVAAPLLEWASVVRDVAVERWRSELPEVPAPGWIEERQPGANCEPVVITRFVLAGHEVTAWVTASVLVQRMAELSTLDRVGLEDVRPGVSRSQAIGTARPDRAKPLLDLNRVASYRGSDLRGRSR